MALSEIDRHLLERCLARKPRAWEDFVDRFMGLVVHVVNHSAQSRSMRLTPDEREDLCAEAFLAFVRDDFAVLRRFRGQSSLATYLTVIARRVAVKRLIEQKSPARLGDIAAEVGAAPLASAAHNGRQSSAAAALDSREEVARLLELLSPAEQEVVRMHHLEGKSYSQISQELGMPENSIGPLLSRAREKMRAAENAR